MISHVCMRVLNISLIYRQNTAHSCEETDMKSNPSFIHLLGWEKKTGMRLLRITAGKPHKMMTHRTKLGSTSQNNSTDLRSVWIVSVVLATVQLPTTKNNNNKKVIIFSPCILQWNMKEIWQMLVIKSLLIPLTSIVFFMHAVEVNGNHNGWLFNIFENQRLKEHAYD